MKFSLLGATLVAATVVMHAVVTVWWVRYLVHRYEPGHRAWRPREMLYALTATAVVLLALHSVEIGLWAFAYHELVPAGDLGTFEEAMYFSFVTFTTLGYGDITLSEGWRLLSGIEALNGILLVGWSTALLFAIVQRSFAKAQEHPSG
ncbi:MAG: potassium channel family protein [Pseudomonadota bacterium]